MNKNQKIIVSMLVLALMALSSSAVIMQAFAFTPNVNSSGFITGLQSPGTLSVWGSSTVGPIATEEALSTEGNFVGYWNNLVSTNGWSSTWDLTNPVSLSTLGSGTAIPALAGTATGDGPADIGEMSRPPSDAEFATTGMANLQQYCVGLDSVAIVLSPDMTWFSGVLSANSVSGLTTLQVAELFAANYNVTAGTTYAGQTMTSDQASLGNNGQTGTTALYGTWAQFFAGQGWTVPSADTTLAQGTIQRAMRDATSGTYDCFNNYFAVPNGYQFEYKSGTPSTVTGAQEVAPYTFCQENINIYNTISAGTNYIGFISLGYLKAYGNMIGLNIAYNTNGAPKSYIAYSGVKPTGNAQNANIVSQGTWSGSSVPTWSAFVAPTQPNVEYAYTANSGGASVPPPAGATGQYQAWRWLWEVAPGLIPSSGPALVDGVWIAYMLADNTTTSEVTHAASSSGPTVGNGASNFVADQYYIPLNRDDFTGAAVIDSNLIAPPSGYPLATQTQSYPGGVVNFNDITYFVTAYIAYYSSGIYNPYLDFSASGSINFNDVTAFVTTYIAYYATTYG